MVILKIVDEDSNVMEVDLFYEQEKAVVKIGQNELAQEIYLDIADIEALIEYLLAFLYVRSNNKKQTK